jgi:hypothetical protein
MQREDYLKDYYNSLEEAPLDVLEEYEGGVLAALDDYKAIGDKKQVKELENDLMRVKDLINKKGGK